MPTVSVRLEAGGEWRRVGAALRAVDSTAPSRLRKAMRDAVKPAVQEAKNKVRSLPVRGHSGHTGLRRKVARGVRTTSRLGDARRGTMIRVVTAMPRQNEAIIPRGLDSRAGWRHPVFGHRDTWVRQTAVRSGWFRETLADARSPIAHRLEEVLQHARDEIAHAG